MECMVEKAFREHVGKGFVVGLPEHKELFGAEHGDAMKISHGDKEITRTLCIVEDVPSDQYSDPDYILLDKSDRRELGINVGESVTIVKAE